MEYPESSASGGPERKTLSSSDESRKAGKGLKARQCRAGKIPSMPSTGPRVGWSPLHPVSTRLTDHIVELAHQETDFNLTPL
jgi:hypothetical protein